jgi:hypothetical protein
MKIEASIIFRSLFPALAVAGVVFVAAESFADSTFGPGGVTVAAAAAESTADSAEARYQRERARCLSGQSQEDQQTCLKEAGAALQAARQHALTTAQPDQLAANARKRCEPLPADQKEACYKRMNGEGTVTGSVAGGGQLRELREVVTGVQPETAPPPAAGPAPAPATTTTTTTTTTAPAGATPLPPNR